MRINIESVARYMWGNIEVQTDKVENGNSSPYRYETKLMLNGHTHRLTTIVPDFVLYSCVMAEVDVASFGRMPWIEDWMLTCPTEDLREHLTKSEIEDVAFYQYGQEVRQSLIRLFGESVFYTLSRFVKNCNDHMEIDNELELRLAPHHLGIITHEEQNDFIYWKPTSTYSINVQ